jgi:TetR/AcrR family transcriptional regulator of autoinduction and epiphytic fitness
LGRREEKREATRQDILSAASHLFKTNGYETSSVDDIVVAANVAKGTFYYHFQKKDDLLLALQELKLQESAACARERLAAGESPRLVLMGFLLDAAHWTDENPELAKAMFKQKFERMHQEGGACPDEHHGPPPLIKVYFFDLIIEILSRAQKAGEIRNDIDATQITRIVIPVAMSARMSSLFHDGSTLATRLEQSMQVLFEGLRPQ